jgi:hypothetical protein
VLALVGRTHAASWLTGAAVRRSGREKKSRGEGKFGVES